jgi:ribosomal protein S18 acetylase RimI-like enzyme
VLAAYGGRHVGSVGPPAGDIARVSRYGEAMTAIRQSTLDDLARIGCTAIRAFVDDPVMRWFFPDADEYQQLGPRLVAHIARRWHATESLWCTDDAVALAGWVPPGRPEVDVGEPSVVDHPVWRRERFAAIGAAIGAHAPGEPHWYLNMLATHPDWQRQGLGAALMRVVFELAEAAGLACYLETETIENVAYYRHHGFEVRSEWDLSAAGEPGPHMWGMLRTPA